MLLWYEWLLGLSFFFVCVEWVKNPFGSLALRDLRSQVRGDSTKNHPGGRSQAPAPKKTWTMLFQIPPGTTLRLSRLFPGKSLGFSLPVGPNQYM